jgi:hypothetical protein
MGHARPYEKSSGSGDLDMADARRLIRSRTISRTVAIAVRTAALLVVVAVAVAACGADVPTVRPSGSRAGASPAGQALGASSAPNDTNLMPCKAADLMAGIGGWTGSTATRFASVVVTSKSGVTCTVRGRPGVRLLNGKASLILDSAKIKGIGGPKVLSGDPVVVLGPGDELTLEVQWTNWCKAQPARPLTVALVLTDGGGLLKATKARKSGDDDAPRCTSRSKPSQLKVTHAWLGPGL